MKIEEGNMWTTQFSTWNVVGVFVNLNPKFFMFKKKKKIKPTFPSTYTYLYFGYQII